MGRSIGATSNDVRYWDEAAEHVSAARSLLHEDAFMCYVLDLALMEIGRNLATKLDTAHHSRASLAPRRDQIQRSRQS